jgi:hypothetical protein
MDCARSDREVKGETRSRISALAPLALHAVLCFAGLAATFKPDWSTGFRSSVIDNGDGALNNYFLEHSYQLVFNRAYVGSLWSPPFFYPVKGALTYSDNLFGSAPIYWIFRVFCDPHFAMLAWEASCLALCYATFAYLLRRNGVGHILSAVGGFLYGFGMPRVMELSHAQLLPAFFMPLAILYLFEFLRDPTVRRLSLVCVFTFWQLLAGIYLGWFLAFGIGVCLAVTALADRGAILRVQRFVQRHCIAAPAAFLVCFALPTFVLLYPYYQHQLNGWGGWNYWYVVEPGQPRWSLWLQPPPNTFWRPVLGNLSLHVSTRYGSYLFDGMAILVAAAAATLGTIILGRRFPAERRWSIRISLITAAAIVCVSLRWLSGVSLWEGIYKIIPGATAIRYVARIWTVVYAFFIFGSMAGLDAILRSSVRSPNVRVLIAIACAAIALAEQFTVGAVHSESGAFQRQIVTESELMKGADVAFLIVNSGKDAADKPYLNEGGSNSKYAQLMLAGLRANVQVINGYSAYAPGGHGPFNLDETRKGIEACLGSTWRGKLCIIVEGDDPAWAIPSLLRQWPKANVAREDNLVAVTGEMGK